jgi:hypothetical protein
MENIKDISANALRDLITSEDKRYEQRFIDFEKARVADNSTNNKAVDALSVTNNKAIDALAATTKTALETAFSAAEKVAIKTERAAEERAKAIETDVEQHRQMLSTLIPRQEWQITVDNFSQSIKKLEAFQSQAQGAESYGTRNKSQNNWIIGVIISGVMMIISIAALFIHHA